MDISYCDDKTGFPRPGHIYIYIYIYICTIVTPFFKGIFYGTYLIKTN